MQQLNSDSSDTSAHLLQWNTDETRLLSLHVKQHGTSNWSEAALQLGCHENLCALKWHTLQLLYQQIPVPPAKSKRYSDWELCVLLMGYQTGKAARMTKKETYEALAGWLPGRTAEGVKQAMNSHIIGHEGKMMVRLKGLKLPASFPELLELWPDLEGLQTQPLADEQAAAQEILTALAAVSDTRRTSSSSQKAGAAATSQQRPLAEESSGTTGAVAGAAATVGASNQSSSAYREVTTARSGSGGSNSLLHRTFIVGHLQPQPAAAAAAAAAIAMYASQQQQGQQQQGQQQQGQQQQGQLQLHHYQQQQQLLYPAVQGHCGMAAAAANKLISWPNGAAIHNLQLQAQAGQNLQLCGTAWPAQMRQLDSSGGVVLQQQEQLVQSKHAHLQNQGNTPQTATSTPTAAAAAAAGNCDRESNPRPTKQQRWSPTTDGLHNGTSTSLAQQQQQQQQLATRQQQQHTKCQEQLQPEQASLERQQSNVQQQDHSDQQQLPQRLHFAQQQATLQLQLEPSAHLTSSFGEAKDCSWSHFSQLACPGWYSTHSLPVVKQDATWQQQQQAQQQRQPQQRTLEMGEAVPVAGEADVQHDASAGYYLSLLLGQDRASEPVRLPDNGEFMFGAANHHHQQQQQQQQQQHLVPTQAFCDDSSDDLPLQQLLDLDEDLEQEPGGDCMMHAASSAEVPDLPECYKQQQQQHALILLQQQQQQPPVPPQSLAYQVPPLPQQQQHYAFLPPTFRQVPGLLLQPQEAAELPSSSSSLQQPHVLQDSHMQARFLA